MTERELTTPVPLTLPNGRLNPDAVGWARRPLVDTSGLARGRGRNKRWEYWNVITPTHIMSLTVSSIDYAAVHEVWVFDRATERTWAKGATVIPPRGVDPRLRPAHQQRPAQVLADLRVLLAGQQVQQRLLRPIGMDALQDGDG